MLRSNGVPRSRPIITAEHDEVDAMPVAGRSVQLSIGESLTARPEYLAASLSPSQAVRLAVRLLRGAVRAWACS